MKTNLEFAVVEDNGGGLHLYVLRDGVCIYAHDGYERTYGQLVQDITALVRGSDTSDWDGCTDDPQGDWDFWTEESRRTGGWDVICDESGPIERSRMGRAGQREFGESLCVGQAWIEKICGGAR